MEPGCELWGSSGGGYVRGTVMMEALKCVVERVEGEAAGRVWVGGDGGEHLKRAGSFPI